MHKVINGKMYDTKSAKKLASWNDPAYPNPNDLNYCYSALYIKRTGEYFLYRDGLGYCNQDGSSPDREFIDPLTFVEAKAWAEKYLDGEEYEEIFGEAEGVEVEHNRRMGILLSTSMYDDLQTKSKATHVSMTDLVIKALRDAGYGKS